MRDESRFDRTHHVKQSCSYSRCMRRVEAGHRESRTCQKSCWPAINETSMAMIGGEATRFGGDGQEVVPDLIYRTVNRKPVSGEPGVRSMGRLIFLFQAFMGLITLWLVHKGRFGREYWRWRSETAFGGKAHRKPRRLSRIRAILAFAVWSWQMRRI